MLQSKLYLSFMTEKQQNNSNTTTLTRRSKNWVKSWVYQPIRIFESASFKMDIPILDLPLGEIGFRARLFLVLWPGLVNI